MSVFGGKPPVRGAAVEECQDCRLSHFREMGSAEISPLGSSRYWPPTQMIAVSARLVHSRPFSNHQQTGDADE